MSFKLLITRVRENLNFKSLQDSAIKYHIVLCEKHSNSQFNKNNFAITCKCKSKFSSNICKALLIKKFIPKLN